jgi:hypothetical protein
MKLWILAQGDETTDPERLIVVRAETEEKARQLASRIRGHLEAPQIHWLESSLAACFELPIEGKEEVIFKLPKDKTTS